MGEDTTAGNPSQGVAATVEIAAGLQRLDTRLSGIEALLGGGGGLGAGLAGAAAPGLAASAGLAGAAAAGAGAARLASASTSRGAALAVPGAMTARQIGERPYYARYDMESFMGRLRCPLASDLSAAILLLHPLPPRWRVFQQQRGKRCLAAD